MDGWIDGEGTLPEITLYGASKLASTYFSIFYKMYMCCILK